MVGAPQRRQRLRWAAWQRQKGSLQWFTASAPHAGGKPAGAGSARPAGRDGDLDRKAASDDVGRKVIGDGDKVG